ncbi:hypothetical protein QC764_0062550 [Podospora pseudoanserina]|uniref:Uncharacterized protein n=1 Tax=Podospora pseudoanserina TaxID=2609844 RepID=A0ABR0I919_9PEZI|nr:hypothetical protein QC764_0062550 [Podospora pseudoanserina]
MNAREKTTQIYPLTLTLNSPSSPTYNPTLSLSLPSTLSPSRIPTPQPSPNLSALPILLPGNSQTTLHLPPSTTILLLTNLPFILSSLPPNIPLPTLLPPLLPFRRIAIPFHPTLTPEDLLPLWPFHFPHVEDIYIVADASTHPDTLRRNKAYQPDVLESFVMLGDGRGGERKAYDVHGDGEDRAWVIGTGVGTGDWVVKGLNEGFWRRGVVMGRGGLGTGPRVGLVGLVTE